MDKFIKTIILGSILFVGIGIFADSAEASDDFSIKLESPSWDVIYGGETKTAELKIVNNTGSLLEGEATFSAWYNGEPFQGSLIAISPSFGLSNNRSDWIGGNIIFSEFEVPEGEALTDLEIQTHPLLMPGKYTFILTLKGTTETGEEHETRPSIIGSSGGSALEEKILKEESIQVVDIGQTSVTIIWATSYNSTSQVVYSLEGEDHILDLDAVNYGYTHTTVEDPGKVTSHSVTISGLASGATYYFRCVSHASPATISTEFRFTTIGDKVVNVSDEQKVDIILPDNNIFPELIIEESIDDITKVVEGIEEDKEPEETVEDIVSNNRMLAAIGNILSYKILGPILLLFLFILLGLIIRWIIMRCIEDKRKKL